MMHVLRWVAIAVVAAAVCYVVFTLLTAYVLGRFIDGVRVE